MRTQLRSQAGTTRGRGAGRGTRPRVGSAVAVLLLLFLAACAGSGDGAAPAPGGPDDDGAAGAQDGATTDGASPEDPVASSPDAAASVVATTSILADVVAEVLGEQGEVTTLVPPGVDPHGYEPSASDAARLREADLVVANGLGLEESLQSVLEAVRDEGIVLVEIAPQLDPIGFGPAADGHAEAADEHADDGDEHVDDGDEHADDGDHADERDDHADEEADDAHGHGELDPHVWFDPVRMADAVTLLADELVEAVDGLDEERLRARAERYRTELLAVHEELEERFAAIPDERRRLVTNHESLGYLADRYDLEIIGTVVPGSTTAETDPRAFAELVETVERAGVEVVFAENTDSTELAEQLASELGGRGGADIEVVRLYTDALGDEDSGAETYLGLLRTTGALIAEALT